MTFCGIACVSGVLKIAELILKLKHTRAHAHTHTHTHAHAICCLQTLHHT